MKAVVSKSDLVNLIGKIQGIVPLRPSAPVLVNVLLEAMDDQFIISATDGMVSMRCYVEAKVIEEGAIALPARRFFQLIRELTSPQVKITVPTREVAEITTGSSLFKIHGMNKSEFPQLPDLTGTTEITLPTLVLKEMLNKTVFSAAREENNRHLLHGVQFHIAEQKATFIGTDGKRLAKAYVDIQCDPSVQISCMMPLKAVDEMIKMLGEEELSVSLRLTHDKISMETGRIALVSKLLSGQYPDVERVIPASTKYKFAIHREELICLLKQVSLFTSDISGSVRFNFETGQLHLSAMSSDIGEGRVSMPVDYAGPPLDIAFNPYFFLDILRHSKEETMQLGLNDSHNPGILHDSSQALFVLMPMRLHETPAIPQETILSTSSQ